MNCEILNEGDGRAHIGKVNGGVCESLCGFNFIFKELNDQVNLENTPTCPECVRELVRTRGGCRVPDWA